MPHTLTASDRSALIRLASTMPVGSTERKAILASVSKQAFGPINLDPFQNAHALLSELTDSVRRWMGRHELTDADESALETVVDVMGREIAKIERSAT